MKKILFKCGLTSFLVLIISLFLLMNSVPIKVDASETYPIFCDLSYNLMSEVEYDIPQDDDVVNIIFHADNQFNYLYLVVDTEYSQYVYEMSNEIFENCEVDFQNFVNSGRFYMVAIMLYDTETVEEYVFSMSLYEEVLEMPDFGDEYYTHFVLFSDNDLDNFYRDFDMGTYAYETAIDVTNYDQIFQYNYGTVNAGNKNYIVSLELANAFVNDYSVVFYIDSSTVIGPTDGSNLMFEFSSLILWEDYHVYDPIDDDALLEYEFDENGGSFIIKGSGSSGDVVLTIYVKEKTDSVDPMISTEAYIYVTDVNNPKTIAQVMADVELQAYDEIDGDLTDQIQVTSDGGYQSSVLDYATVSNTKAILLGDYALSFFVEDSNGNEATASIIVRVVDTTNPTVSGTSTLTRSVGYASTPITNETIIAGVIAEDNHDGNLSKVITENNYNQSTIVGSYTVKVRITDDSENYVDQVVTIQVYDNVAPVFSGASTFYKSYDIAKSVNDIMTFCEIDVEDVIDGSVDIEVESDTYTGSSNIPGTYSIVLKAIDLRGNQSTHTITVTVADEVVPYFLINRNKVIIQPGVNFTPTMLINTLRDVGVIQNTSLSFAVINDTYTGNESNPGTYEYDLRVLYQNGVEDFIEIDVEVLEEEDSGTDLDEDRDPFFVRVWNSFKKISGWIAFPFVWLYNHVLKPVFTFSWVDSAWTWIKGLFVKL